MKQITSSTLKPRNSRLGMEIKHQNPALLLEWYKVSVCLTNLEEQPVSDVCLNLSLNRNNNEKVELSSKNTIYSYKHGNITVTLIIDFIFIAEVCEDLDRNLFSLPVDFKLDSMLVGDQKTQSFYIRSSSLDTRYFQLMVSNFFIIYRFQL